MYSRLTRENADKSINELGKMVLENSIFPLDNEQVLVLVRALIKYDSELVLKLLKSRTENEDMSAFMARMDDIMQEK